jgi:TPP-dependent pyruvate/acetoin dehydrogenase alpha subunit
MNSVVSPSGIDRRSYEALYRQMVLIRRFEDLTQSLFEQGHVHGTTHLYSGQEAVAVGMASMLGSSDRVAGTYRGHGHAIALGMPAQGLLDELLGRASGICGGRAGSMNVVDLEHRLIGCFGIVGGSIAAATGAALALKGTGAVAVAFFGDGTTNQGYFFECLNFAKVHNLPVLYVCENNLYGEFTPWEEVTAGRIGARPEAFELHVQQVDGNDLFAVREGAARALAHVRSGAGPAFIEAMTYRFVGHSRSDPGRYRKPGEFDAWRARDPLLIGRRELIERYGLTDAGVDRIIEDVRAELAAMREAALAAPFPSPGSVEEFKPMSEAVSR